LSAGQVPALKVLAQLGEFLGDVGLLAPSCTAAVVMMMMVARGLGALTLRLAG
jgi:hypothetical protein